MANAQTMERDTSHAPRVLCVFQVPGLHLPADIPAVRKLPLVPKAHQYREGKRLYTGALR